MRDRDPPPEPPKPPEVLPGELVPIDAAEPPAIQRPAAPPADIELDPTYYSETPPPAFLERMFGIGFGGWVQLAFISVIVGAVIRTAGVNPFDRSFTLSGALNDIVQAVGTLGGWVVMNGWTPFLIGALVVAPLWLLWRLLSLPFRRSRSDRRRS